MSDDIFGGETTKSIDDYLGSLKDSLREELSKDKEFAKNGNTGLTVKSGYIRLRRKDLSEIILIHDNHGTIMWNGILVKYRLESQHLAAGIYKVWLQSSIEQRTYLKGIGKALCSFGLAYYGKCSAFAEIGQEFCVEHLKKKCSCGQQATYECSFAGQFVCGRPLCKNCKCNH